MLTVKVPVGIKLILTEQTKQGITGEINQAIQQIQHELEQIEFQARKALADAEQHGPEAVQGLTARINQERGARMERREQLMQQLVQIQQSPINSEIPGGQVESSVNVSVGDIWEETVQGTEIVLKDGVVVEIRRAGDAV
ncbi:YlqD family protein [Tumebacillus permanentifrigoris]|uniref:YlqD protein n=1 Tax=Tumebacillus permanentifrigoris TaxID=378543 RepID=A0A316D7W0_9BACL|nr:YlqD family protein [Tumebacillus permanentifrigoris]PWK12756.1 YlqD protein [Tumebacillus permanentifrigoris]